MIGRVPKNGLGVVDTYTYRGQGKRSESNSVDSLTESGLLALGDDVDAGAGVCALVEGTCNSKGLEHAHKRQL